ncbi:MAG: NADH-quinone oxidoreductase subunit C [Verrucomicrobiales bacterium]|jgi:NADH:ubiquinone oxidoreductase subunit C|nr:NADH-quinone oxidoreductase subunit C [Verrucomicrobiales bacterium]
MISPSAPSLDELTAAFAQWLAFVAAPATVSETKGTAPDPGAGVGATSGPAAPVAGAAGEPAVPWCRVVEGKAKGYHFEAQVLPGQVVEVGRLLFDRGFAIDAVTGVDWMAAGQMELVYDFFHPSSALHVVVRCRVPREGAEVPTLSEVFPGANWHERETHDFFGIVFTGHPDLSPFLLPEDADYHPLRKDFAGAA